MIELDLGICCPEFQHKWRVWAQTLGNPAAMLPVMSDDAYLEHVGRKTRNMCRKAAKHFFYGPFVHDNFLEDIEAINRSRTHRQGIPMTKAYTEPPQKVGSAYTGCQEHRTVWIGGYDHEMTLVAYAQLVILKEWCVLNKIIGHGDHLSNGVMNGLVREINRCCFNYGCVRVNYLTMPSKTKTLEAFKYRTGFRAEEWRIIGA